MNDPHSAHRKEVDNLARRAEELIDRRTMFSSASRKLALPVLVTYV